MAENYFYWIVVYGWSNLENPELTSRLFLAFVGKNSMHCLMRSISSKWWECLKMIYSKDSWWVPVRHALAEKWHLMYIFLKLNLESLTIYYDLQLCEGFCCIELVLTEICTLSANVMTTDRCNVNVLSSCFSAYCNALFYCCGIFILTVMESIFRVSDNNGPWMSAWRLRPLRPWHQAGCEANVSN